MEDIYNSATLPKCHPTLSGHWACGTYEEYPRMAGESFDIVYYGDDNNEIAYMILTVQPDGSLAFSSDTIHASCQPSHGTHDFHYMERSRAIIKKFPEVGAAMRAYGQLFVSGKEKPKALKQKK